ncbi:SDR family oxidoreductase [Sphingomonas aurantiaca]|uniref:SDR family NAD(P)-dependent oxidoreductase n=1 Tax=Sphingomonas aurantiaca TaxID=185949 RepID=UPI002FE0294B
MQRLNTKTCVVTGAARGIGRAIAERFHDEGADVILTDIDETAGQQAAAAIGCRFQRLDVRDEADWQRLADYVPIVDVVVNNAGVTGFEGGMGPHDPEQASLADWRAVHAVNLDGTFLGCRYAIGAMKAAGNGAIINISSRSGLVGIPSPRPMRRPRRRSATTARRWRSTARSRGGRSRCNSVHPAAILTPMWEPMLGTGPDRDARMQALVADTLLKRFGMPHEVAAVAVMLASDEATYITGTEINIDGGLLAGSAASPG